ncbi:MAG TPA: YqaJ viral recombinase family protein, partial [Candidatus Limnocylindrales bacterium]|nr:YqaJ viral recombinase family protein [Candidatus Limnocylindrales bacterium]
MTGDVSCEITPDRDRAAWLRSRGSGLGGSEAAEALGLTGSRYRLFLRKRGMLDAEEPDDAMRWGLMLEPLIAAEYERRTGERIVGQQRFLRHPEMPWVLGTLDALTESGRVVDFKAVGLYGHGRSLGNDGDSETLPDSWVVQINQYMALARANGEGDGLSADVAVYGPGL